MWRDERHNHLPGFPRGFGSSHLGVNWFNCLSPDSGTHEKGSFISLEDIRLSRNIILISAILIAVLIATASADVLQFGNSSPCTLTVLIPYDQSLSSGLKNIAEAYGKDHNTVVNIITVKGRKKIIEEITSRNISADLVIIEKEYPIFNLTGLKTLEKKGFIETSQELTQSEADLVVSQDSPIQSARDLEGRKYAAVDLVNYHMPGGCLANSVMDSLPVKVTAVNQSGIDKIYESVSNSSADATVLWKSDYIDQSKKGKDLKAIPMTEYSMDNFIATLKGSANPTEAKTFMDFVVSHNDEFG